jgi:hypothetical protein
MTAKRGDTKGKGANRSQRSAAESARVEIQDPAREQVPVSVVVRATGPRTLEGKNRSKYNAVKHGIFASVVLDGPGGGESRSEFRRLHEGLREDFNPEGTLEEILVEKLAMILWRHARLVKAETAEIRKTIEFVEWDETNRQWLEAEKTQPFDIKYHGGLARRIENPVILERCLELLAELRQGIAERGFNQERDWEILTQLYGNRDEESVQETFFDTYEVWRCTSEVSEEERERKGYATPEECKEDVLGEIDHEVHRLKAYKKRRASVESARAKLEVLRRRIPDTPESERLLRYEASLERSFERTLSQLERLQRMRLGHAVPPPLKVELSR